MEKVNQSSKCLLPNSLSPLKPKKTRQDTLFEDYRIQSNAADEITLKISTDALALALKSASSASSSSFSTSNTGIGSSSSDTIIKLAKKNDRAVLSFEIVVRTRQNRDLAVTQDVNIEVLSPGEVERMKEPMCPEPDVRTPNLFFSFFESY